MTSMGFTALSGDAEMDADIPGAGPVACNTPALQPSKSLRSNADVASEHLLVELPVFPMLLTSGGDKPFLENSKATKKFGDFTIEGHIFSSYAP